MFSHGKRGARSRLAASLLLACLALPAAELPVAAQERMAPVPNRVIYPGDMISEDMLTDVAIDATASADATLLSRAALIGKVAKRTLLPGQKIFPAAVANPRAVANGAQVTLIYRDGALNIVTSAQALEAGGVGDTIKVRNQDSGLTVSGTIQPDGSVCVSNS